MGVGGQLHAPAALPPGKRPGAHCTGGWVDSWAGLNGCRKSHPNRDFFFPVPFFPLIHFVLLNPSVLHVTLRSILLSLYNKHNTDIHASGGIRTHNSSKRAAADSRLRPHGHWNRNRSPDRPTRSQSLYRLSYPGPCTKQCWIINVDNMRQGSSNATISSNNEGERNGRN
jgi:hypothetical protein